MEEVRNVLEKDKAQKEPPVESMRSMSEVVVSEMSESWILLRLIAFLLDKIIEHTVQLRLSHLEAFEGITAIFNLMKFIKLSLEDQVPEIHKHKLDLDIFFLSPLSIH